MSAAATPGMQQRRSPASPPRRRQLHRGRAAITAALALAVVAALVLVAVPLVDGVPLLAFTADDAYISFRYSGNLADGHGPVWNVGGPRVDGYTSPLWMVIVAAGEVVGLGPEATSKAVSLLAGAGILAMLAFAGGRAALLVRTVAIGALVLSPAFMAITVQGFETTTAAFLAAATVALLLAAMRRPRARELLALAVTGTLAVFARPDLVPFVVVCFAGLGAWLLRGRDLGALRRAALWVAAGFVVPGVLWAAWHWSYYGYPLPNTSSVKRSTGLVSEESVRLIATFLTQFAGPFVLGLAVLALRRLSARRRGTDPALTWAVGSALVGAAAFLGVGLRFEPIQGAMWRFQMPIFAVLLLCAVLLAAQDEVARNLGFRGRRAARGAAFVGALLLLLFPLTTLEEMRTQVRGRWVDDRQRAGEALARFRDDGMTMFVSESGVLPWAAGWRAYDLIGLNDRHIALHGATVPYVSSLRPDVLQWNVAIDPAAEFRGFYRPFVDLLQTGEYRFAVATVKTNRELVPSVPPAAHFYFVRRDAPNADAVLAALRSLRNVRVLSPEITERALRGFGYTEAATGG